MGDGLNRCWIHRGLKKTDYIIMEEILIFFESY